MVMGRKRCQHCGRKRSLKEFEAQKTCEPCIAQIKSRREARISCPKDGTTMEKIIGPGLIILDKCPTCEGFWLDKGELQALEWQTLRDRPLADAMGYARA